MKFNILDLNLKIFLTHYKNKVENFFMSNISLKLAERDAKKTVQYIKSNVKWMRNNYNLIREWLLNLKLSKGKTSSKEEIASINRYWYNDLYF